jgi:FKBP-type peptidyl-prolyl cis-trans isomerase FkpA
MKTIKNLLLILVGVTTLVSCAKSKYRKTPGGMPYQVFSGKGKEKVKTGDFIKVQLTQVIKDSVYFTTAGKLAIYMHVAPKPNPYDINEMWSNLSVGDSVISTQLLDTFINRSPQSVPPQFKKGDKIITYAKVIAIFPNDSLARIDDEKGKKELLDSEIKELETYLAGKNITTQKTPSGSFVQIIKPGEGNLIDSGKYVTVYYTGTSFSGKKFDSNTDTSFHHTDPLPFVVNTNSMIKGFDEAVQQLKPGGVAKVYIPSMLGYAGNPPPGLPLKPYEHLVFDIEIKDVLDKAPATPAMKRPPQVNVENIDAAQPKN